MLTQRPGQPLGLVAAILGPSSVSVTLNGTNRVRVLQETEYPFAINPTIRFVLRADAPFPFSMRVPSWAVGATLTDASGQSVKVANGSIHEYLYTPSSSNASTTVSLRLPTSFRVERRYNNAVSVYYGGLLMALDMDFNVTVLRQYAFHSQDLQMLPTTPWAYALQLDEADVQGSFTIEQRPISAFPFDPVNPPLVATAYARAIDWPMKNSGADVPPMSPVQSTQPLVPIRLIPYGSSMLRIAEIPVLARTEPNAHAD